MNDESFDLVLATVGRADGLERLFRSLAAQSFSDLRVLLVEQDEPVGLDALVERFASKLQIVRLRSERGLSRARNAALPHIRAAVVGFPDDDCWYPPDLLAGLSAAFASNPDWDGISCVTLNEQGKPDGLRWDRRAGPLTRRNLLRRAISPGLFVRRSAAEAVGPFDETLGVGAGTPHGSGEEADYLLRALEHGLTIVYRPELAVYHPGPSPRFSDRSAMAEARRYGVGHTEVLLRHGYSRAFALWRALQLLLGAPAFLLVGRPGRARFYFAMARGRLRGLVQR